MNTILMTEFVSTPPREQPPVDDLVVVLDNIRSVHNVGAIFRTADAAGVSHIYLLGYTPAPIDRFGRAVPEIAKTALGAETMLSWTAVPTVSTLLPLLHAHHVVAIEQTNEAVSLFTYRPTGPTALVFGNEVDGVSAALLEAAETTVYIPMYGNKESLNASVSAGIALYTVRNYQSSEG